MAIQISSNGRLMTLQTNDSSYQMLADKNGVLLHLYYGSSIGAEDLSDLIVRSDVGFSGNPEEAGLDRTYSLDTLPQEVASSGVGDFRDDSVRLAHPDGSCAADFVLKAARSYPVHIRFRVCRHCMIQKIVKRVHRARRLSFA